MTNGSTFSGFGNYSIIDNENELSFSKAKQHTIDKFQLIKSI